MTSHNARSTLIVALLATCNRDDLLFERSIPSIYSQICLPDRIVVVNDSPKNIEKRLKSTFPQDEIPIDYMNNRRSKGAAGAWNSGIDHIARNYKQYETVFVAILDDDDSWESGYLFNAKACIKSQAEVIATQFLRIEEKHPPKKISPPEKLIPHDFFVGNPGIQGSNLMVRLDTMLKVGCFDESFQSSTDRDLCIRLSHLCAPYQRINITGVRHYACSGRDRLSSPQNPSKHAGLDQFIRKYGALMTGEEKQAFTERAVEYFSWNPINMQEEPSKASPRKIMEPQTRVDQFFRIAIGFIADDNRVLEIGNLLSDILKVQNEDAITGVDVIIVRNNVSRAFDSKLANVLHQYRKQYLRIYFFDMEQMKQAYKVGEIDLAEFPMQKLSISTARTILQTYMYHFVKQRRGTIAWILDDDMRLEPLMESSMAADMKYIPIAPQLQKMKLEKIDIAIGQYTGAAPLPAFYTVRCQLLDLVFNVRRLSKLPKDDLLPDGSDHNRYLRTDRNDYYYDLSRKETDRLEVPFHLSPVSYCETVGDALGRLGKTAVRIFAGEQIFRPLVQTLSEMHAFTSNDRLYRGGNSFIFDIESLADMPNIAAKIEGHFTRRSDMVWALFQKKRFERTVKTVPISIYHDRSKHDILKSIDVNTVINDIRGYAVFMALSGMSDIKNVEEKPFTMQMKKYVNERFSAFRLSFYRIIGLSQELKKWAECEAPQYAMPKQWIEFSQQIDRLFSLTILDKIERALKNYNHGDVVQFLKNLNYEISQHKRRLSKSECISSQIEKQRRVYAKLHIRDFIPRWVRLTFLGSGKEGVSFTDGNKVFKIYDYCGQKDCIHSQKTMKTLVNRWSNTEALYPILEYKNFGTSQLQTYPYEKSTPYMGGYGNGMVNLLLECLQQNIVCRNIHPKNLRVVGDKVRLIDYGISIRYISDSFGSLKTRSENLEFKLMCKRAFLSWKYQKRNDLQNLMHAVNSLPSIPELRGFTYFFKAVCVSAGILEFEDPIIALAKKETCQEILDYGCGQGKIAKILAEFGKKVIVYDPDKSLIPRLKLLQNKGIEILYSKQDVLRNKPFDLIICRQVACIVDGKDFVDILKVLRSVVSDNGKILLGFCHPEYNYRCITADAVPINQKQHDPQESFIWKKIFQKTGRIIKEFHRPISLYEQMFHRAGLRIIGRHERESIDHNNFEAISDLLVFELGVLK